MQRGVGYLKATVASKGGLKQCDCDAAVADVMPSSDLVLSNEGLCGVVHGLQAADLHIRCVITQLAEHLHRSNMYTPDSVIRGDEEVLANATTRQKVVNAHPVAVNLHTPSMDTPTYTKWQQTCVHPVWLEVHDCKVDDNEEHYRLAHIITQSSPRTNEWQDTSIVCVF